MAEREVVRAAQRAKVGMTMGKGYKGQRCYPKRAKGLISQKGRIA
jgi:hypothetical protein